jgi:hypothetical protein
MMVKGHVHACRTDYFEAAFANARSVVEPSIMDQTLISYEVCLDGDSRVARQTYSYNSSSLDKTRNDQAQSMFCDKGGQRKI